MSWKNVKEAYQIGHAVQITEKGICIGSPYIHDLIVISLEGEITKRDDGCHNEDLRRYMAEMDSDPEKLKRLVKEPDTFAQSITVYTYDEGKVIKKECEELGWPNVTHDGEMMYENTFSENLSKVIEWAIRDADARVEWTTERVSELKKELERAEERRAKAVQIQKEAHELSQPNTPDSGA